MALVLNGDGTVTGLAVGGLPDGTVDAGTLATDSVIAAKLGTDSVTADALKDDAIATGDLPTGSMLQIQSTLGNADTLTTSTSWVDSGHSVAITPSSTSSKILIELSNGGFGMGGAAVWLKATFYRDSTELSGVATGFNAIVAGGGYSYRNSSMRYLDSPSSTSELTYKVYFKVNTGTGYYSWSDRGKPLLTVTEIAG